MLHYKRIEFTYKADERALGTGNFHQLPRDAPQDLLHVTAGVVRLLAEGGSP